LDEDNGNEFSNSGGRLSLFTLGKIYRWLARGKIMALFSKSFMMSNSGPLSESLPQKQMPIIKMPIVFERKVSKRSEEETLERRTFPDPGNNLDDEDRNIETFDNPGLMNKWLSRAHGNNELSATMFRIKQPKQKLMSLKSQLSIKALPSSKPSISSSSSSSSKKSMSKISRTPNTDSLRRQSASSSIESSETSTRRSRSSRRASVRPEFVLCTHIRPDCLCARRAQSKENIRVSEENLPSLVEKPRSRSRQVSKSAVTRRNLSVTDKVPTVAPRLTQSQEWISRPATDYYTKVWDKLVDEAAHNVHNFDTGKTKQPFKYVKRI